MDNSVIKLTFVLNKSKGRRHRKNHHICLDRAYQSESIKQEIINRGYVPHIPYKRKRVQKEEKYGTVTGRNKLQSGTR